MCTTLGTDILEVKTKLHDRSTCSLEQQVKINTLGSDTSRRYYRSTAFVVLNNKSFHAFDVHRSGCRHLKALKTVLQVVLNNESRLKAYIINISWL